MTIRFARFVRCLPLLLLTLVLPAEAARLALVIGNADYVDGPLKNPVRDARAIAAKLGGLGFAVTKVENLKRDDIGRTLRGFANRIGAGDDVVVFYAGHGLQVKGVNYLPAVDARIDDEADVALNSLNLNDLLDRLDEAKASVKIVMLDACRNNPYARSARAMERGLARIANAPAGTLIHYATRPGKVAADGSGEHGLYTSKLLPALGTPGLPVEQLFKQVAIAVVSASGGDQEPWIEGNIRGHFVFNPGDGRATAGAPPAVPAAPGATSADFGDLEQAQRQTLEARMQWAAWQRAMQAAFDKAAKLTATPEIEAKAWERFLASYAEDNQNATDDERLRMEAGRRLAAARAKSGSAEASTSTASGVNRPGFRGGPLVCVSPLRLTR